jgi:pyridoxamine 5'-phosphate oxidase
MALATASPDGVPSVRIVLLKGIDERGLQFFTNYGSRKGRELDANPRAAVTLHWAPMHARGAAEGAVERLTAAESDAYFASRGRGVAARGVGVRAGHADPDRATARGRASPTRSALPGRGGAAPEYWGGYRLVPEAVELWQGRPNRLHDREHFLRGEDGGWRLRAPVAMSRPGGPLDVDGLAVDAVRSALDAAAELAEAAGWAGPQVSLSRSTSRFPSCRASRPPARQPSGAGFAPLSRIVRCRDGWARTHANYPHHEGALRRALAHRADAASSSARPLASGGRTRERDRGRGGCAAALRTEAEWTAHPAGAAVAGAPWSADAPPPASEPGVRPTNRGGRPSASRRGGRPLARGGPPPRASRGAARDRPHSVIAGPWPGGRWRRSARRCSGWTRRAAGAAGRTWTRRGQASALLDLSDAERAGALLAGRGRAADGLPAGVARPLRLAGRHRTSSRVAERVGDERAVGRTRGFDSLVQW